MNTTPDTRFTARTTVCPSCGEASFYSLDNRYRPFCSERCKNMDFGAWANEAYRMPVKPSSEDIDPEATGS